MTTAKQLVEVEIFMRWQLALNEGKEEEAQALQAFYQCLCGMTNRELCDCEASNDSV